MKTIVFLTQVQKEEIEKVRELLAEKAIEEGLDLNKPVFLNVFIKKGYIKDIQLDDLQLKDTFFNRDNPRVLVSETVRELYLNGEKLYVDAQLRTSKIRRIIRIMKYTPRNTVYGEEGCVSESLVQQFGSIAFREGFFAVPANEYEIHVKDSDRLVSGLGADHFTYDHLEFNLEDTLACLIESKTKNQVEAIKTDCLSLRSTIEVSYLTTNQEVKTISMLDLF